MWASMFKENKTQPNKLLQDILNVIRDILVLINDCYHHSTLDWLISIMPNHSNENNNSPSL